VVTLIKLNFFVKIPDFYSKYIHTSFVNDGYCDCCDGSDEYSNIKSNCKNRCYEESLEIRKVINEKINVLNKGLAVKNQLKEETMKRFSEKRKLYDEKREILNVKEKRVK